MIPNKTEHEGAKGTKPSWLQWGYKKKYRKKKKEIPTQQARKDDWDWIGQNGTGYI